MSGATLFTMMIVGLMLGATAVWLVIDWGEDRFKAPVTFFLVRVVFVVLVIYVLLLVAAHPVTVFGWRWD